MNASSSWIEPPPQSRGMGCLTKGCLILLVFAILLCLAFIAGIYYARYNHNDYFSTQHESLPVSNATVEEENTARARWDAFEKAARAHEPARIELTADDLNALIAGDSTLRGDAYVTIQDNIAHLHLSIPVGRNWWLRGRYLNAKCSVESGPSGKPEDARIANIVVNGRPVGDEILTWQIGSWSFKRYVSNWTAQTNLKTFEISDGKAILETNATSDDSFASPSPAESPAPSVSESPSTSPLANR